MKRILILLLPVFAAAGALAQGGVIVSTDAYTWKGDTIYQGEFAAWAPDDYHIVSTYSAQPHYYMPVDKEWKLKNDISMYPRLRSSNTLHNAIYNMGLDEMVNAVESDTTLRTGKEWAGVWTRDVSYSIILSMAYMQPLASEISLRHKVTPDGRIVQDTGSGGAWPVSTDRMIWAVAAWELYKATGDKQWLEFAYPVIKKSLEDDFQVVYAPDGLVRGETSFIDWREQSYPKWMQCADIYNSESMSTSVVHAVALDVLSKMASELGDEADAAKYAELSGNLSKAINDLLWLDDKGYYGMYLYGRDNLVMNPRAETLGESLAILYDVAPADRQKTITENNPTTPYGAAIFYPQIADMPAYHNNALWPWVGAMWTLANAKAGNEEGTLQGIGSVFRPAALFATNKENFNLDNGDIATELNSSNMLWCLSGNLAITYRVLFGIHFEKDGLAFMPFVPKTLGGTRTLENFTYRDASLDITVSGYGDRIKSFRLNGKEHTPFIPGDIKGHNTIDIVMADNEIAPMKVNNVKNQSAPLTPIAHLSNSPELDGEGVPVNNLLSWLPIEYIDYYVVIRDGEPVHITRQTSYPAVEPGEYMVAAMSSDEVCSFVSEPVSNRPWQAFELPEERALVVSDEVSYRPELYVEGFNGRGFREVDHKTAPIDVAVSVPEDGEYYLTLRYSNGNGPVNTENKCAIRTVLVDGDKAGVAVMPQRGVGNWDDWGITNPIEVSLKGGDHVVTIEMLPENENMNIATNHALIDRVILTRK